MAESKKIRITLKKSVIGSKPNQRRTIKALGLGKINSHVEKVVNPQIMGMVHCVAHLVEYEEL